MAHKWAAITLSDIASIGSGRDIYEADRIEGDTPYITAGTKNNGIGYFVGNVNETLNSNVIVVNRNGAVGHAFFHPYKALVSNDCRSVKPKETITPDAKLFLARAITEQRECFSYSRKLGTARANKMKVMLPVDDEDNPDWDYMSSFAGKMRQSLLERYRAYVNDRISKLEYREVPSLDDVEWGIFTIEDVFDIRPGKRLEKRNMTNGARPFIGASDSNNGVTAFVGNVNESLDSNVLGINYNGSVCEAFYHPYECVFSDDVKRLHLRNAVHLKNAVDVEFVLLFMGMLIRQQKRKYEYAYKFNEQRMRRQTIMLPTDSNGLPDYDFMGQYIKNMMLKKYRQFINYAGLETKE